MMKLLQINSVYKLASTGRTSYELEKYLGENGWECHMAYAEGPDKEENMCRMGTLNRRRVHNVLARVFGKQGYFSPLATRKLIRYIRKTQPDVIHLRNLHSSYVSIVPLLKEIARLNIPIVITLHDFWFFTGGCCFFYECDKYKKTCVDCVQNSKVIGSPETKVQRDKIRLLEQINTLAVVGVSKWATAQVQSLDVCQNRFVETIYNWIDFDIFHYTNVKKEEVNPALKGKFCIVSVATVWGPDKGLYEFIRLSEMLSDDCKIVLIGSIPNECQLPNNILSVGQIQDVKLLADYYSVADVYISLSNRETFGKTIAEAVSCSCPAIVQNVDACPEVIGEGCGYVVEQGDLDGVLNAIEEIRKNGKEYYSENCIKHTRTNFDYRKNAERYNVLYKNMIDANKKEEKNATKSKAV